MSVLHIQGQSEGMTDPGTLGHPLTPPHRSPTPGLGKLLPDSSDLTVDSRPQSQEWGHGFSPHVPNPSTVSVPPGINGETKAEATPPKMVAGI